MSNGKRSIRYAQSKILCYRLFNYIVLYCADIYCEHAGKFSIYQFRNKGFPFAPELTILFKDVAATSRYNWAPTLGTIPSSMNDDDVYHPTFGNIVVNTYEGSRDSKKDLNVGSTKEMRNINLTPFQGTSS